LSTYIHRCTKTELEDLTERNFSMPTNISTVMVVV
jgi:hypothetical protein